MYCKKVLPCRILSVFLQETVIETLLAAKKRLHQGIKTKAKEAMKQMSKVEEKSFRSS